MVFVVVVFDDDNVVVVVVVVVVDMVLLLLLLLLLRILFLRMLLLFLTLHISVCTHNSPLLRISSVTARIRTLPLRTAAILTLNTVYGPKVNEFIIITTHLDP